MKNILVSVMLMASVLPLPTPTKEKVDINPALVTANVVIVTIDGFRWQELFCGADSGLINNKTYTPDATTSKSQYWVMNKEERRKKLMPFVWTVMASNGQLYGNRQFKNKVNIANAYAKSYPGYSEIFTGVCDPVISSNRRRYNPNMNVLEWLDSQPGISGKVAAFTSWDMFPFILNDHRSKFHINSGQKDTRSDELTFIAAKKHLNSYHPRVLYIGLGEADEFAHEGRYDLYLKQAVKVDSMIANIWYWVQSTNGYKNNTTLIITTDHGRGSKGNWTSHGRFIRGSKQTWLAVMGPHTLPLGEVKIPGQIYQEQLAQTIAHFLGREFTNENAAAAIAFQSKP